MTHQTGGSGKARVFLMATGVVFLGFSNAAWAQNECVWGSFDTSRINYSSGTLEGGAHVQLRAIIAANGGTIAAGTPLLTDGYLSGVDIFYTSLLNTVTGTLSDGEQTALQDWISGGGTLIVTADIFPLPAYESFTSFYGITGYTSQSHNMTGFVLASHPVTNGVSIYRYNTESTFSFGGDGLLLGDNGLGVDFMAVFEPGTGFTAGGRILVFGDHNMFTGGHIGDNDNTLLANNFAKWACRPVGNCLTLTVTELVAGQRANWDVSGADANTEVAIVYGFQAGLTVINGFASYCASFGINGVNANRVICRSTADGAGRISCSRNIPGNAGGTRVLSQAAMRGTCPDECMSGIDDQVIQ